MWDKGIACRLLDYVDMGAEKWDSLNTAVVINDSGSIAGVGTIGGKHHAYLATLESGGPIGSRRMGA